MTCYGHWSYVTREIERLPSSLTIQGEDYDLLRYWSYVTREIERLPSSLTIQGEDYDLLHSLVACHQGDREVTLQFDHPRRGLCPAAVTVRMSPGR